jgi:hypothetical protein
VDDAASPEEAQRKLLEMDPAEFASTYVMGSRRPRIERVSAYETASPAESETPPSVGDPKPEYGVWHSPSSLNRQCREEDDNGMWCTRDRAHESPHVANDSRRVLAVWDGSGPQAGNEDPQYMNAAGQRTDIDNVPDIEDVFY